MKKIIPIIMLFVGILANAQEPRTVTTSGSALFNRETTAYRVKVTLNMDQVYYSDPQVKSLEELKEKYFKTLREEGLDPSVFKELRMEFLSLGYQKEGTVLSFETTSQALAEKMLGVKMNGITMQYQFKAVLSAEKRNELRKTALLDARKNAEDLCKISGGILGEIVNISETTPRLEVWSSYYDSYDELLALDVSFELK